MVARSGDVRSRAMPKALLVVAVLALITLLASRNLTQTEIGLLQSLTSIDEVSTDGGQPPAAKLVLPPDAPVPPFQPALLAGKTNIYNVRPLAKDETSDNASKKFKESPMMHKYLDGLKGLEIGASSHNGFGLNTLNVDYTHEHTEFSNEQLRIAGVVRRVDVIAPGNVLPFQKESVDFVISSHAIEHFHDPIGAICEWLRVVKVGGYVATVAPHKERTFDKDRERTPLSTLIDRHSTPIDPSKDDHHHWSVWITKDFLEMCTHMGWTVVESQDKDDKVGNGFSVLIKKTATSMDKC